MRRENELMSDFVARVDEFTGTDKSFAAAADALQKNAFGHCAEAEDAKDAAEYALFLREFTLRRIYGFNKFYFVYLRKLI